MKADDHCRKIIKKTVIFLTKTYNIPFRWEVRVEKEENIWFVKSWITFHLVMKQWEKLCMQSITDSSGIWN